MITPPPPSLIFRIIRLRTFSLQIIEPQRFTSKFFISSNLRREIVLVFRICRRQREGGIHQLVMTAPRSDTWQPTTDNRFSKSFPRPTHWVQPSKTQQRPPRITLIPRRVWLPQVHTSRWIVTLCGLRLHAALVFVPPLKRGSVYYLVSYPGLTSWAKFVSPFGLLFFASRGFQRLRKRARSKVL